MAHEFTVEFEEQEDGPEPGLRERFGIVASRRLGKLEEDGNAYPEAGGGCSRRTGARRRAGGVLEGKPRARRLDSIRPPPS